MIELILKELSAYGEENIIRSVLLTGGRSAKDLYEKWFESSDFIYYRDTKFYFGDERCVPMNSEDSNYNMVRKLLPNSYQTHIERIQGESTNLLSESMRYSKVLPNILDLVLLSVGEDGHIASLFPFSSALKSKKKVVHIENSPKNPKKRITVSPLVLERAKHVIVMASNKEKGKVLARALNNPKKISELPVRLTIGRTWVLNEEARDAFLKFSPEHYHNTNINYV